MIGDPGLAGAEERIGVLSVETAGVSRAAAQKFERGLEEALTGAGFHVTGRTELRQALVSADYVVGCTFGPCLQKMYERTGLRYALVASIRGKGPSYSFVVTLLDTLGGAPTSQVAERCSVCTVEEAISTATLAVIGLVTGTGSAEVRNPGVGPVASAAPPPPRDELLTVKLRWAGTRTRTARRSLVRTAWVFVGAAFVGGAAAAALVSIDRPTASGLVASGSGALLLSGTTMLWLSTRF
jgi:hypothetical protein